MSGHVFGWVQTYIFVTSPGGLDAAAAVLFGPPTGQKFLGEVPKWCRPPPLGGNKNVCPDMCLDGSKHTFLLPRPGVRSTERVAHRTRHVLVRALYKSSEEEMSGRRLIFRLGPAPEDTEDTEGRLHCEFTEFAILGGEEIDTSELERPRPAGDASDPLVKIVAAAWRTAKGAGHGHLLVGSFEGFEYVTGPGGCGDAWGLAKNGLEFRPKKYRPLFAVAHSKRPAPGAEHPAGKEPKNTAESNGGAPQGRPATDTIRSRVDVEVELALDYRGEAPAPLLFSV
jgi:hypothetical protein